jgi:hypothetical protein
MIATALTQEQVDQVAREFGSDVVRIRFTIDEDWSGDPAIHFRILLSDDAGRPERLIPVTKAVEARLDEAFGLWESDRIPYFNFRGESEQAKLKEAAWG